MRTKSCPARLMHIVMYNNILRLSADNLIIFFFGLYEFGIKIILLYLKGIKEAKKPDNDIIIMDVVGYWQRLSPYIVEKAPGMTPNDTGIPRKIWTIRCPISWTKSNNIVRKKILKSILKITSSSILLFI